MARSTRRTSRRPRSSISRVALAAAGLLAVIAVVWAVVVLTERDGDPAVNDSAADSGVTHVHGLGVNPADGSLVVATHNGSFRIPAGSDEAERIGEGFQDTMGFTVAGPDHFLGSGHPDVAGMQTGQPGRLGLIESTDGGATWTNLSLSGEVDFHALAVVHDLVYGWDSGGGRFMVSADRHDWETRSRIDLYGFAVDPDDADHVVAATPEGLAESSDGGRTWVPTDGPVIVALSWDATGGLFGITSDGAVWQRTTTRWEPMGRLPGEPQALLVTADAMWAAAHAADGVTGIYRSTDEGRTWAIRYRDEGQ